MAGQQPPSMFIVADIAILKAQGWELVPMGPGNMTATQPDLEVAVVGGTGQVLRVCRYLLDMPRPPSAIGKKI